MTPEDSVMNMLANGEVRLAEAARMLDWPQWRMSRHAARAGIDARAARRALVARLMSEAEAIGREIEATGKPMPDALADVMERARRVTAPAADASSMASTRAWGSRRRTGI